VIDYTQECESKKKSDKEDEVFNFRVEQLLEKTGRESLEGSC
jgi:hypothetical protein